MALFDVGVWTKKRPSALKGSGIAAAFKKWEKAVPNDDPATVTSEEDYQAAVDAIETAMLVAGRTITTEKKKLETECEKKKKGLKDKQKEKKIDEQYDEEVKKWLPVTNQLGFWKTDLANFDRRYQAAKSKALGLYDKHLKEIMDAYKTCVEGMNVTEKDAVKLRSLVTTMVDNVKKADGDELDRLKIQYKRAMPKVQSRIDVVDENMREINGQNRESSSPLKKKIDAYHITQEDVMGPLSKLYIVQTKASNRTAAALKEIKKSYQELGDLVG